MSDRTRNHLEHRVRRQQYARRRSVPPQYAKVKSPSQFEKGTANWRIEERDGRYQVALAPKHRDGRGWEDPRPENVRLLPVGISLEEAAEQVASIVQSSLDN